MTHDCTHQPDGNTSLPLNELFADTNVLRTRGEDICVHPRQLADASVFFKLRSPLFPASAADAIRHGAKYVVLQDGDEEEAALPAHVSYAIVDDVNRAFARVCARLFGDAHRQLTLIGVTGTKGKTTVCHLIDGALRASGVKTGLLSSAVRNTNQLDALSLHSFLATVVRQGGTHAVLELTSRSVAEEQIFGLQFDALVFTNFGGKDEYLDANRQLFTDARFHRSPDTICALNSDDPAGRELAAASLSRVVTYGAPDYTSDAAGITLRLGDRELRSPLIGRHNASNLLAAAAVVEGLLQSEDAALRVGNLTAPPGRLEKLRAPDGVDVYLDCASVPWTVETSLSAVREIAGSRRVVSIIGGNGKIEKSWRASMARAAIHHSDLCIITSDDPRQSHPASLVMDMLRGVPAAEAARMKTIIDRRMAIEAAVREAQPDGIVVLMGRRMLDARTRAEDGQAAMGALQCIN